MFSCQYKFTVLDGMTKKAIIAPSSTLLDKSPNKHCMKKAVFDIGILTETFRNLEVSM